MSKVGEVTVYVAWLDPLSIEDNWLDLGKTNSLTQQQILIIL